MGTVSYLGPSVVNNTPSLWLLSSYFEMLKCHVNHTHKQFNLCHVKHTHKQFNLSRPVWRVNLRVRPTRRQPMRCLCTPLRWTLCGEEWGRWALCVKWGVSGGYRVQPRLLLGEGALRLSFLRRKGCGSNSEVLIQVRPSTSYVSTQRWENWWKKSRVKIKYWGTQAAK